MAKQNEPGYFGFITSEVLHDPNLSDRAKLLFCHISVLVKKEGYCWASNAYFEKAFNVKKNAINNSLRELEEGGFIRREVIYREGTKAIEKRKIYIVLGSIPRNTTASIPEDTTASIPEDTDKRTSYKNKTKEKAPLDGASSLEAKRKKCGGILDLTKVKLTEEEKQYLTNDEKQLVNKGNLFWKAFGMTKEESEDAREMYPLNKIRNRRQCYIHWMHKMSVDECKLAIKNVKRYLSVKDQPYQGDLLTYLKERRWSEQWLRLEEEDKALKENPKGKVNGWQANAGKELDPEYLKKFKR